jgi:hypothetical protein
VGESAFALGGDELNVRDNELAPSELAGVAGNRADGLRKKNMKTEHVRDLSSLMVPGDARGLLGRGNSRNLSVPAGQSY